MNYNRYAGLGKRKRYGSFRGNRGYTRRYQKRFRRYFKGFFRNYGKLNYSRFIRGYPEIKAYDTIFTDIAVSSSTGTNIATIVNIGNGTNAFQRIGEKVRVLSVSWRFNMYLGAQLASINDYSEYVRFIIYVDKQCNGVGLAGIGDLLQTGPGAPILRFKNHFNNDRFEIIKDTCSRVVQIYAYDDLGTAGSVEILNGSRKCNVNVGYSGPGTGIGDIVSNNIGMLMVSFNDNVYVNGTMRVRYTDS